VALQVKNHRVLMELLAVPYHPNLIKLICWCAIRFTDRDHPFVFTSGYRTGDKGVHGLIPCRGMDIRSSVYGNPQKIVDEINAHFIYDPKRPFHVVNGHKEPLRCAKYHGPPWHIHLQAHNRTQYLRNPQRENGTSL